MSNPTIRKVVVVEDNLINLELVTDLLEAHGCTVSQARSGEEGLRLAESILPDLILMDLSLPGKDGLATTRALRNNPPTANIPIIALTAHAMKGDEESALNAGCDGYLSKPINTRTLTARIAEFVEAANARRPQTP